MNTVKKTGGSLMLEFKKCPMCNKSWPAREEFLKDQQLILEGYQANFESLDDGLFLFTHHQNACHSTLAVEIRHFLDLYNGPRYTERKTGTVECPGFCIDVYNLRRCRLKCECKYIRELMHQIRKQLGMP
jgi:hypothetical protein